MVQSYNVRKGCKDVWQAFMCKGADFTGYSKNDIPYCPTTASKIPLEMITWTEAINIYRKSIANKKKNFRYNAFICFFSDDHKFDGKRKGIWENYSFVIKVARHFEGIITPDFSTNQDFPDPIKRYNTYRMRAFGYWLGKNGIAVINNIRWGTRETWSYCWDGIPRHSVVCVGTVGGNPRRLIDRRRFEEGLDEMVRVLQPHTILVYGSANYSCFKKLNKQGIKIVSYPGKTSQAYAKVVKK